MPKIHQIPPHVVSKIAAGEIIERPVFAVKELVENALDAGASSISVQIFSGGLEKIVVTDDGSGMDQIDLRESIKPHTTSKLSDDSLNSIDTLGFRGEALASIAAISELTIQSRVASDPGGFRITNKMKSDDPLQAIGMPTGTSVTIEKLFSQLPARKKFLKSEQTEFRLIVDLITKLSISYPSKRFLLLHNSRVILDLPKKQSLVDRINSVWGKSLSQNLLPIQYDNPYISLSGFIAKPQEAITTQNKQFLYVNNRSVSSKVISAAIKSGYGTLLEKNKYPVFILFLNIPYEFVDVNIHPRKEHVGFSNISMLTGDIQTVVERVLSENNLFYTQSIFGSNSSRKGTTQLESADILREHEPLWNVKDPVDLADNQTIIQIHKTYFIAETTSGMVLVDQHAAHERILYEQLMNTYKIKKQTTYVLEKPQLIDLTTSEKHAVMEFTELLNNFGFYFVKKNTNYYLTHKPELFKDQDVSNMVREIVNDLMDSGDTSKTPSLVHTMISYLSCRSAIMAGDVLTQSEAKRLLEKLKNTPNNATCPHGRPTLITVSIKELNSRFKRS